MSPPRTYRHLPWLLGLCFLAALAVTGAVLAAPDHPAGAALLVLAVPPAAVNWRVRTLVDDSGVTQHWLARSFHVPWDEITGLEIEHVYGRWFLRVLGDDRTFEIIPCHTYLPMYLSDAIGRPRALRAALADIEHRLNARQVAPGGVSGG